MVRNGIGFKVFLTPNDARCRSDLRIHPDGVETKGTAGCIGLPESKNNLIDKKKMESFLQHGRQIDVNVNIDNNPNYSDCDENGRKKTNSGPAGN